jgi:dipeptide/tripeptide permease
MKIGLAAWNSEAGISEPLPATSIPIPKETVSIYGNVYGWIGLVTLGTAVLCLALTPLLKKWMHIGVEDETVA